MCLGLYTHIIHFMSLIGRGCVAVGMARCSGGDSGHELVTAIPSLPPAMLQIAAVGMKGGISHIYSPCLIVI